MNRKHRPLPCRQKRPVGLTILALGLLLSIGLSAVAVAQVDDQDAMSSRDQTTLRMVQLAQAGKIVEARDVLRGFLEQHPTDGTMLYNLACFDLVLSEPDQAMIDFERALVNGYSNFRLIDNDKDLDPLRHIPRFSELVSQYEHQFRDVFQARSVVLDEGYVSDQIPMWPNPAAGRSENPAQAEAKIVFDGQALQVSVFVTDPNYDDQLPPWLGGSGVLVNLIQPVSPDDYESRRYYSYGFGAATGEPVAALVSQHAKVLLQGENNLQPRITRESDTIRYDITIPWEYFDPYAPPLDQEMGLNVQYLGAGQDAGRQVLAFMPEDRLSFETNPWRRYVPVFFYDSDRSAPDMHGRLYEELIETDQVDLELGLLTTAMGPGQCRLWISDLEGNSSSGAPVITDEVDFDEGLNFLNYTLDAAELSPGRYQVNVLVSGPGGLELSAEYPFSRFRSDWLSSLNERIHILPPAERALLKYRLMALAQTLDRRHPLDDPTAPQETYEALTQLVSKSETTGSCLPDDGYFLGGFPVSQKTLRFCAMYLPPGYRQLDDPQLLVVLPSGPRQEHRLARALGEALQDRLDTIVLVPQSQGHSGLRAQAGEHTQAVVEWAQQLFQAGEVTLVGLGAGADAALETSLTRADLCRQVLLSADHLYLDAETYATVPLESVLNQSLQSRTNDLPYTLATMHSSEGRMPVIADVMQGLGFQVREAYWQNQGSLAGWVAAWFNQADATMKLSQNN